MISGVRVSLEKEDGSQEIIFEREKVSRASGKLQLPELSGGTGNVSRKLIIVLDNTHSYLRGKVVRYRVNFPEDSSAAQPHTLKTHNTAP